MRFKRKVAIITGGASGIGLATARLMAREGARVLISDVTAAGEATAAALVAEGLDVVFHRTDVSREDQVAAMLSAALERWRRLDVMVANAGVAARGSADRISLEDWNRLIGVNLTGVYLCIRHAVPAIRASGGGAIVTTASAMGLVAPRGAASYAAAKAGVVNLTRASALDFAADNIRVNAVCPGFLLSPTNSGGASRSEAENRELIARHPLGRLALPEDVAAAIAFLASDDAAFITGVALPVDGGYTAQ